LSPKKTLGDGASMVDVSVEKLVKGTFKPSRRRLKAGEQAKTKHR